MVYKIVHLSKFKLSASCCINLTAAMNASKQPCAETQAFVQKRKNDNMYSSNSHVYKTLSFCE